MQAIILCAGYATRMYPLTKDQPKPLLPLAGKPLLDYIVEGVSPYVSNIAVVSNTRFYPHFSKWAEDKKNVTIVDDGSTSEENRLGAVGDLLFALNKLDIHDDVLMIAGDNYFEFPIHKLIDRRQKTNAPVIALRDLRDPVLVAGKFGVALVNSDGRITGFEEKPLKPRSTLASTACYVLTKESIDALQNYVRAQGKVDNLGTFIAWLSSQMPVYGCVFNDAWHDIGSLEEYYALDKKLSS